MRAPELRFGIILASGIISTPMVVRPAVLGNLRVGFPESLSGRLAVEVQAYPTPGPGGRAIPVSVVIA